MKKRTKKNERGNERENQKKIKKEEEEKNRVKKGDKQTQTKRLRSYLQPQTNFQTSGRKSKVPVP